MPRWGLVGPVGSGSVPIDAASSAGGAAERDTQGLGSKDMGLNLSKCCR